jgi:phage tail sheath gpL-like
MQITQLSATAGAAQAAANRKVHIHFLHIADNGAGGAAAGTVKLNNSADSATHFYVAVAGTQHGLKTFNFPEPLTLPAGLNIVVTDLTQHLITVGWS